MIQVQGIEKASCSSLPSPYPPKQAQAPLAVVVEVVANQSQEALETMEALAQEILAALA